MKKITQLKKKHGSLSSRWLLRHLNDPYVIRAKKEGYICRSAYKLLQIQERFSAEIRSLLALQRTPFLPSPVLDLGCAPGGWVQVMHRFWGKKIQLIGVDLQALSPSALLHLNHFYQGDFCDTAIQSHLQKKGPFTLILSDMAPNASGNSVTDRLQMEVLIETLWMFSQSHLQTGGGLIFKSLRGGLNPKLSKDISSSFQLFKSYKPDATHKDSSEIYTIAMGFKSPPSAPPPPIGQSLDTN